MKKLIIIITVFLLLSGCGDARLADVAEQLTFPTEAPPGTPDEATAAAEPRSTVPATATAPQEQAVGGAAADEQATATMPPPTAEPSPSPSPSPTASPRPSPTPPSPEAILGLALHLLDTAEAYHFEFSSQMTEAGGDSSGLTLAGDFVAPYTLEGEATLALDAERISSHVISYDEQYYESPDGEDNWHYYPAEPGHLGRADLDGLWAQRPHEVGSYTSLTYEGIEALDGKPCYHLQGVVPGSVHVPPVEGDVAVDMLIGVEDGALLRYEAAYEQRLLDTEEMVEVQESNRYSNFNQPAAIDIPAAAIASLPHEETALSLAYEAPGDWTVARSGEGCAQGSCPGVTLYRDRPGGPHSTVTLTLLSQAERPFMEEVMTPPDYEERELGGMAARVRQGEGYVDGLIYPDGEHAVQLSARWEGYPEEEAAVWQILESLASTIPPSPEGFTRHTLPGWGSIDIPDGWHFVNPPAPDQMVFSSADVDFTYDAGPEDALVMVSQFIGDFMPPFLVLTQEVLPNLEYEWDAVEGPKAIQIGEMAAATVTYHGYEDYMEMAAAVRTDDNRLVILWAIAGEEAWPAYERLITAMRDSIRLEPIAEEPQLAPSAAIAQGYAERRDEEQGYAFAYPEGWQLSEETAGDVVSNYLMIPPGTADDEIALVKIYPPSTFIVGEDSANERLTAVGQLDALANWSGDLTIRDALRTGWTRTFRTPSGEYAASYFVATKDGRPIHGFMGAMTDGESAVKMIAWFEDIEAYREQVLAIFNSIHLINPLDLDRDAAKPLELGTRFKGQISGPEDQYLTFEAVAGQTYLVISEMDLATSEAFSGSWEEDPTIYDVEIYDVQDNMVDFYMGITYFYSWATAFMAEESGPYAVAIRPYNYREPASFDLYLLPVGEGERGTLQMTAGKLDGGCQEFSFADVDADRVAIYAAPTGSQAAKSALTLSTVNSSGQVLFECADYCAEEGIPTVYVEMVPDDKALTIRVCESEDQPAEFDLIIATLPD